MSSIELDRVSVSFPIYSAGGRSFKNAMLAATTGGKIGQDAHHVVVKALDQVSLTFVDGDRVGLIGHNGAGKTTLLRVLAGIYEPHSGQVNIDGRVTPLFDINLGFDLESSGYENIVLRGLYLGLTKAEIVKRRDEVAEFTQLGPFLDLPVRTYSAGMQARLAFSMSTCIDPEILLLDEGISTGDAAFMERANQRLESFIARTGVLVLASHSDALIHRFCNKVVWLEHGVVRWVGDAATGLEYYRSGRVKAS